MASHAAAIPAAAKSSTAAKAFIIVLKEDGVNHGISLLCGCDCGFQTLLAASVHTVREDDESFAALLFFHQLIRGQIRRVIKLCAAAKAMMAALASSARIAATVPALIAAIIVAGVILRNLQSLHRRLQLLAVGCKVLQQFHLMIKMDHKCRVFALVQHLVKKAVAGVALLLQHASLAQAGIHQQAQRERKIGLSGKVTNRLWVAIFLQ